jgi:DNA-binding SARP family transcriptional activator
VARQHGLDRTPGALWGLALVEYHAGRLTDARAALEEVVDLARDSGERQFLSLALAYLAIVAVTAPQQATDLFRAVGWAAEAVESASVRLLAHARTAHGWVLLAAGDLDAAAEAAGTALREARRHGTARALGPAYELLAAAQRDPADSEAALLEAHACYQRSGEVLAADRVLVCLGRLPGRWGRRGSAARAAARRLHRAGAAVSPIHPTGGLARATVESEVMGGFEVSRDGVPVPPNAWRSRQARTLLKLLVARDGRPLGREEACDLLWPDDDPERTGHRLSVLLSSLRNALDPDRSAAADHLIAADTHGIRLVLAHVSIDLRDFLEDAGEVARLVDAGEERAARVLLADVVAAYGGEAFEDDPYESWASDAREHARAVWLRTLRLGARLAGRAGDIDDAVSHLLRVLAADPYDEPAHRMLVAVLVRAGRHGEADRAFERWSCAMHEVGALPPDPDVLGPWVDARVTNGWL